MYRIKIGCHLTYTSTVAIPAVFVFNRPPTRGRRSSASACTWRARRDRRVPRHLRQPLPADHAAAGREPVRYEALAASHLTATPSPPTRARSRPRSCPRTCCATRCPAATPRPTSCWLRLGDFSHLPRGWARARAICDWVHDHIEYKPGVSLPHWSAADIIARRQGVCRDRAHVVVALCRAFNMPARYAVSYLPDIDVPDDGIADGLPRLRRGLAGGRVAGLRSARSAPRKGRVFIASGLDAADAAFATIYGGARLTRFEVWADPIPLYDRDRAPESRRAPALAVVGASESSAAQRSTAAITPAPASTSMMAAYANGPSTLS